MNSLNPVTFRGTGLNDGKERNLTIGRTWITSKQSRTVVPDGPHRLDPGDKLDKLCPIVIWNTGCSQINLATASCVSEPVGAILLDEDAVIALIKDVLRGPETYSLKGPQERGSKVTNQFAVKKIVDKVICRICHESKTKDIQEALKDSLVLDLENFTRGLALLFPKGELDETTMRYR